MKAEIPHRYNGEKITLPSSIPYALAIFSPKILLWVQANIFGCGTWYGMSLIVVSQIVASINC